MTGVHRLFWKTATKNGSVRTNTESGKKDLCSHFDSHSDRSVTAETKDGGVEIEMDVQNNLILGKNLHFFNCVLIYRLKYYIIVSVRAFLEKART